MSSVMAIFTIIGSIIGAGFASGQEIYLFFFRYGIKGLYGLIICSSLIAYVIYKVLNIAYEKNIDTYYDFFKKIFNYNKGEKKYFNIIYINNIIVNIFLLVTFFIMIAGFGAYFEQELGIRKIIGSMIIAILAFVVFKTDIKGFTKLNTIIIPILILCMCILGIKNIHNFKLINIDSQNINNSSWLIKSITYGSYNIILLVPVLINLKRYIENKKNILCVSILAGGIFFILSICVFLMLANTNTSLDNLEMPIIYIIKNFFPNFKIIYGIVILISIFTTATSVGISFLENYCNNEKSYTHVAIIMCIIGVCFSNFGFSNMVKVLFPVFGYVGILQIFLIAIN